jgi:pimeloyl-ACP methyl ester carboxylesterase
MNYTSMAEDVIHFLNKKGIEKVELVGHSVGGKVAQ